MIDFKIDMKKIWRYHSDKGTEFLGACDDWLKELLIHVSTTAGYESQSNSIAENLIGELEKRYSGVPASEQRSEVVVGGSCYPLQQDPCPNEEKNPRPCGGD